MRCEEAQELITGLVDDELSAGERSAIESHLGDCPDCRGQLERETALKNNLHRASVAVAAPAALREKVHSSLDGPGKARRATRRGMSGSWFGLPRLRPLGAFAIVVLVVAALVYQWRPQDDFGAMALATHERVASGKRTLERSRDPSELRRQLALAVNNRFAPVALDLSMAKLYPVAGFVEKIAGRDVLVTVYEGDGSTVTCYTFLGTEADAPKGAKLLRDEETRVDFFIFSQGDRSAVMHEQGEVICILVAKMAPEELLDLLRNKAHHA